MPPARLRNRRSSSVAAASHEERDHPVSSWILSKHGILFFRLAGGISAAILGVVALIGHHGEKPLALALLVLGLFVLSHTGIESWFHAIRKPHSNDEDDGVSGFREFASAFMATSGVILGLLAVFGDKTASAPFTVRPPVIWSSRCVALSGCEAFLWR